jgi:hypothetical protein
MESLPRGEWILLPPSERTRRIYHEMRRLDAERATFLGPRSVVEEVG